ncbi:LytR C-terminal domain-containing protein [Streptacidiphilus monticola]
MDPAAVRVTVQNGSGVAGRAAAVTLSLRQLGFAHAGNGERGRTAADDDARLRARRPEPGRGAGSGAAPARHRAAGDRVGRAAAAGRRRGLAAGVRLPQTAPPRRARFRRRPPGRAARSGSARR